MRNEQLSSCGAATLRPLARWVVAAAVAACASLMSPAALAADGSWNVGTSGSWDTSANWLNEVIPGSTTTTDSTDIATFNFGITTDPTITVDANRNIGGITFGQPTSARYILSDGNFLLSNGGVIQSLLNEPAHANLIRVPIEIQGDGGSATFTGGASNTGTNFQIERAVTGVSTAGNTTTLTLNGINTGFQTISGTIGDGSGGGRLAVVKNDAGRWGLSGANTFSGGVTLNAGTLRLGNAAALGTGTFTIAGGSIDVSAALGTSTNNNAQAWNGDFTFLGANTLNLGTGAVTMNANRTVTVNASTLTVGGAMSDGGSGYGLTKAGNGTLSLGGTNTYTGVTSVNAGVLLLNNASALPGGVGATGGTSGLTLNGGVVGLTSDFSRSIGTSASQVQWGTSGGGWAAFGADRTVNLGGNETPSTIVWGETTANGGFDGRTLVLGGAGATHTVNLVNGLDLGSSTRAVTANDGTAAVDAKLSGSIVGTGGLTKAGNGTLSLDAANTYTGVTTVSGGVLLLNNTDALPGGVGTAGGTSGLTFAGGAVGLTSDFSRSIGTSASQVQWAAAGGWAAYGADRTVNLGGSETPSTIVWGDTTANGGFNGQGLILGGLTATHTVELVNGLDLGSTNRTVTVNNGAAAFDAKISGNIDGSARLLVAGDGTLLLSGSNSFNGLSISVGKVAISNASALGTGDVRFGNVKISNDPNSYSALASTSPTPLTISNPIVLAGNHYGFGATFGSPDATGDLIFAGGLDLSGFINQGYGMWLNGLSSVDVTGTVSGGYGGYFRFTATNQTLRFGADNSAWTGGKKFAGGGTVVIGHAKALGAGTVTLAGQVVRSDVDLTGANALTNAVSFGSSTFAGTNSIELAGLVDVPGTFQTLTNNISGGSLVISGSVSPNNGFALSGTGNTTVSGNIANRSGIATVNITFASTGITTFSGTNTYTGATTVSAGTLVFGGTQAKAPGTVTAAAAATIGLGVGGANSYTSADVAALFGNTLSGFSMNAASGVAVDTTDGNFTVSDDLAGSRAFTKLGPNTLTLSGSNTYAGDTTISGGTLKLASGGSFANSPQIIVGDASSSNAVFDLTDKTSFSIGGSQTLMGKGTVLLGATTALTIDGLLSPGNSPGLLTYDGGGTVTLSGTTLMEVWGTSRGVDPGYDAIDVLGGTGLNFGNGILQLDFNQTFADGTTFNLFTPDGTSSLTGNFSSISMVGSSYSDLTFTNNAGVWTTNTGAANQSMSFSSATGTLSIVVVPEPAGLALLASAAIAGCVARSRRRTRRTNANHDNA